MTTKPVLYVANVDEDQVANPDDIDYVKQIREFAATENAEVVVISARVEEEISELDDEDKEMFLEDLGLTESGVDKLTRAAYHLLGLGTYFTAGEKRCVLGPLNEASRLHRQLELSTLTSRKALSVL